MARPHSRYALRSAYPARPATRLWGRDLAQRCWNALILALLILGRAFVPLSAADVFDADRALVHAQHLSGAIGERTAGSDGEHQAAAWLASLLVDMGYAVEIQPFVYTRSGEETVGLNIVATQPGRQGYGVLYVAAHYDSAPVPWAGPGANDNASGVSVLLEAARVLARQELTPTLKVIAFSAEEDFLVGSKHYVSQMPAAERLTAVGMFNLDCVGIGDALYVSVLDPAHLRFAQSLGIQADSMAVTTPYADHAPFAAVGIPALWLNMRYVDGHACGPDYHKPTDTVDKLESAALQRVGTALVTAVEQASAQAQLRHFRQTYLPLAAR